MKIDSATSEIPSLPSMMSRWLAGGATLAGSALAAGSAAAATVQIDLVGNEVTSIGRDLTDSTYADLTGDGIDDLSSSNGLFFHDAKALTGIFGRVAGVPVGASFTSSSSSSSTTFRAFVGSASSTDRSPVSERALIPVAFTDANINDGAETNGYIEVLAENISSQEHRIALVRLIFDDENREAPMVSINERYPLAFGIANSFPMAVTKSKLEKKIAALERKIRAIKKNAVQNPARLNFYRLRPATIRQIAALERQVAALKRKLGVRAR